MDKKMKKPYESPSTKCTLVEMEAGLCAASRESIKEEKINVTIEEQGKDADFTANECD